MAPAPRRFLTLDSCAARAGGGGSPGQRHGGGRGIEPDARCGEPPVAEPRRAVGRFALPASGSAPRADPGGGEYAAEIRGALNAISKASLRLTVNPSGGSLDLAILPTFGMRWLVPRLPDFARRHPEVTINLTTRLRPFSFASEPFDAAIHFGLADWPGTQALHAQARGGGGCLRAKPSGGARYPRGPRPARPAPFAYRDPARGMASLVCRRMACRPQP
jgi:LysR family glycine cleavage system transcriptional activator